MKSTIVLVHRLPLLLIDVLVDQFVCDSAGGRYAFVAARGDRPKYKIADQPTAEEIVAATEDFFAANFGTWSVNEADKTLTRHYDAALRPNNDGQDFKSSVSLMGDELKLTGQALPGGFRIDTVHRRAR